MRYSPQEKKALAYRKDHVVLAEYPHAYRRQVRQLLDQARENPMHEDDERGDVRAEAVRRRQVWKWGVTTLRDWVDAAYEHRIYTTAWNFFKKPYHRAEHRERFVAFLASITASTTPYLRDVASFLGALLDETPPARPEWHAYHPLPSQRTWLRAFLADAPEWEPRLRAWIDRAARGTPR